MNILKRIFNAVSRYGWATTLVFLGGFAAAFTWSSSDDLYSNIRLFDKTAITVTSSYVEGIDEYKLIKAGIDGMMSKLDPYSRYLSGADYYYLLQETDGEFEGIGISLGFHHDTLTVESVLEGTPAYQHGIKPGDRLLTVDGLSTSEIDPREIKMMLRGTSGSKVNLTIHRPANGFFKMAVEREQIEVKALAYSGLAGNGIGYIRMARFSEDCSNELKDAIRSLKKQGMKSLIFDLRGNPGGLLLESVKVASMFLHEGIAVVETRGRDGRTGDTYASSGESDFQIGELVVLVDSQTASAAEIVAGAVQDHDRGIIIGNPTYGKGLVQQVLQFSDDTALKLTTAKYYLPSGRCLQKPDWSTFELVKNKPPLAGDSLYKTDSGRPVFGGGGIIPDVYIEEPEASDYIDALQRESLIFDFCVNYVRENQISSAFRINSAGMDNFRQFVESRKFIYESQERAAFKAMQQKLGEPNPRLKTALAAVESELASREKWQFDSQYSDIAEKLEESIVVMAQGENALYENIWLKSQPCILRALEILSDNNRYADILSLD